MPFIIIQIIRTINKADWIHLRVPTNLGLFVLPLLTLYKKKKWIKYAGNWKQKKVPLSYSIQRWWLKKNLNQSIVTINGKWEDQQKHLLSFPNPCLNEEELNEAVLIGSKKDFSRELNLCYVGRLDTNKGIINILKAIEKLGVLNRIKEINVVGGGEARLFDSNLHYENIIMKYFGWLNRKQLNKIYEKSHIILLPSHSEGFPKVLAEAAAYGCIPVTTSIPPINQYFIDKKNGFLLNDPSIQNIQEFFINIEKEIFDLKDISTSAMKIASQFTYNHYINRIQSEIIDA